MSENKLRYQIIQEFQNVKSFALYCICCIITQSFNVLNMLAALPHRGHTVDSAQSFVHTARIILCLLKLFCVFQFSSLKWLLPQLLTTQVLVIRGFFLCWSSNQTQHIDPGHHHMFTKPALLTYSTCMFAFKPSLFQIQC